MPFLACVEIHNADLPTYYRLHAAMEAESFKRVITGANDFKQYRMPLGTYWTDAFDDSWEAFNAAQRAALPIDATAQVILCGTGPILFQNCRQYVEQPILGLHSIRQNEPQRPPAPKPKAVALSEPALLAGSHHVVQTQTHRSAPKTPRVPEGGPSVAGVHRIPQAEPQRPEANSPRIAHGEPSVPELHTIPQTPTHRPMAKSTQVAHVEPSPGPHSTSYGDPYGTPPAPNQVPRGKHSLAGLRSLFQTDPYGTPPSPPQAPLGKHTRSGFQGLDETDPYGSLPRLPMGARYGTR